MSLERVQCISDPNSGSSITKCIFKSIDRHHIRIDFEITLNHTVKAIFFHFKLFYQISNNQFQPFMNVVEDFCGYMKGDIGNILLRRSFPKLRNITSTSINHKCPYAPGKYFVKNSNLTVSSLASKIIIPSGRCRAEISLHEGYEGPLLGKAIVYFSISDHRIERF